MAISTFGLLNLGAAGMRAGQFGVSVSSQNVSNATTVGYTRRSVHQDPASPPGEGGNGVIVRGSARMIDRFVERRLLGATSDKAGTAAHADLSAVLDEVLGEAEGNVGAAIDAFTASLRDVASDPTDIPARQGVLGKADALSAAFNQAATAIDSARTEADERIGDTVKQINVLTHQIADLQNEMKKSEISGQEASDLRDQRDQRIRELAELVPVTTVEGEDGAVDVLIGGREALVTRDGQVGELVATPDPTTGRMQVSRLLGSAPVDVTNSIDSGKLGGWLRGRDVDLAGAQSRLDQLAYDLATSYNTQHSAGYGLDASRGRNLFTPPTAVAGAARALSVSTDVVGNPRGIAAASDGTLVPGDNINANLLVDMDSSLLAGGGLRSFSQELADMVSTVGTNLDRANRDADTATAALTQVSSLREGVSGVNTDEETVAMMRYQAAYQASARVVQTADEMLQTLLELKQ